MTGAHFIGGYHPLDGTIEFYGRVNALTNASSVVVDLGCGRAGWFFDDESAYRKQLRLLKGKAARVIGLDVDNAAMTNPSTDENHLINGDKLPLPDACVDIVVCDYVLEHVLDPGALEREVLRILKPNGFLCARTPHRWNYVSMAARLIGNGRHSLILKWAQPHRKIIDVFSTAYRCNSLRALERVWGESRWRNFSYIYTPEPSYVFDNRFVYALLELVHKFGPAWFTGNIFVFLQKR